MSLITYTGLRKLVDQGVVEGAEYDLINAASIDVRLGDTIWTENVKGGRVDLAAKETPSMHAYCLTQRPFELLPGEFILAQTKERFHLPSDVGCEFRLKSSGARSGLDAALAVWCDPGWHGSVLTMELRNNLRHHKLVLTCGMKIGQMVFYRGEPVPHEHSYASKGQYNNDITAQPSKGVR